MVRYAMAAPLLVALAMILAPAGAAGQRRPPPRAAEPDLAGTYENVSAGGTAYVYKRRGGYLFVNEQGSEARFEYTGAAGWR